MRSRLHSPKPSVSTPFKPVATQLRDMPATAEVVCERADCELDMFEVHYTYDVPEEHSVDDLVCPYCSSDTQLSEVEL